MCKKIFDSETLNMPVTKHNLALIRILFPKIKFLILIIKSKYSPELFLLKSISKFKYLTSLTLNFEDSSLFDLNDHLIKVEELKLYNQKSNANKNMVETMLNRFTKIKSLTILAGNFQSGTSNAIRNEKITRLSIKNTKFESDEINNFKEILFNYNLFIFKLVATDMQDQSHDQLSGLITDYLSALPHKDLRSLSISLPNKNVEIDFQHLYETLKNLIIFRIFFTRQQEFNTYEQLIPAIKYRTDRVRIQLFEYRNTRIKERYMQTEIPSDLISNDIPLKKVVNPYTCTEFTCRHVDPLPVTIEELEKLPQILSSNSEYHSNSESTVDMNVTYEHLNMSSNSEQEF